jgi:hypothetical protein
VLDQRPASKRELCLVPAHAAGFTAGEDETNGIGLRCGDWRITVTNR